MRPPFAPQALMPRGMGRFAALVSLALLSFGGTLHAQDFEGKNITNVDVRYIGAKTVDEARIRNLMLSKSGTAYRAENLDTDIRSLYDWPERLRASSTRSRSSSRASSRSCCFDASSSRSTCV